MAYRLPGGISAGFAQGQLGTGLPGGGEDGRMLVDNGASQLQLQQLMHMQGLPTSSVPLTLAALNGNVNLAALQEGAAGAGGAGAANASGNSLSRLLQLQGGSLAAAQEQQHQGVDHDSQYKQLATLARGLGAQASQVQQHLQPLAHLSQAGGAGGALDGATLAQLQMLQQGQVPSASQSQLLQMLQQTQQQQQALATLQQLQIQQPAAQGGYIQQLLGRAAAGAGGASAAGLPAHLQDRIQAQQQQHDAQQVQVNAQLQQLLFEQVQAQLQNPEAASTMSQAQLLSLQQHLQSESLLPRVQTGGEAEAQSHASLVQEGAHQQGLAALLQQQQLQLQQQSGLQHQQLLHQQQLLQQQQQQQLCAHGDGADALLQHLRSLQHAQAGGLAGLNVNALSAAQLQALAVAQGNGSDSQPTSSVAALIGESGKATSHAEALLAMRGGSLAVTHDLNDPWQSLKRSLHAGSDELMASGMRSRGGGRGRGGAGGGGGEEGGGMGRGRGRGRGGAGDGAGRTPRALKSQDEDEELDEGTHDSSGGEEDEGDEADAKRRKYGKGKKGTGDRAGKSDPIAELLAAASSRSEPMGTDKGTNEGDESNESEKKDPSQEGTTGKEGDADRKNDHESEEQGGPSSSEGNAAESGSNEVGISSVGRTQGLEASVSSSTAADHSSDSAACAGDGAAGGKNEGTPVQKSEQSISGLQSLASDAKQDADAADASDKQAGAGQRGKTEIIDDVED